MGSRASRKAIRRAPPAVAAIPARPGPELVRTRYIVGPAYDAFFFILSPVLGLAIGFWALKSHTDQLFTVYRDGQGQTRRLFLMATLSTLLTNAHLAIVFLRSHLNGRIFRLYPWRFTVVPLALWIVAIFSQWAFVLTSFAAFWWDVYHSSLQTFGLGRIYDQRAGNDPQLGRRADYLFNLIIYCGPIFAGANLLWHLNSFQRFQTVNAPALVEFAEVLFARREPLQRVVVGVGVVSLILYLLYYVRLIRAGYRAPWPKLALFTVTAAVSIAVWGFGSFGDSVLIMNFFHAFQYFGIVWWSEKTNLTRLLFGQKALALLVLLAVGGAFAYFRTNPVETYVPFLALGNVVALMHFWYDGFIWSVRKGQV